jgi:alkylation response protein AidB-like acyl-CoA dehydrogenase
MTWEEPEAAVGRFVGWLGDALPDDYHRRYREYRRDLEFRRSYQLAAFEAGWLVPDWEEGLGGQGMEPRSAQWVRLEAARRAIPKPPCVQAVGIVAHSLRTFGTPEQRDLHLVPALRGDEWWALGMSEPDAGSDLRSLRTTASVDGNHYVLNGSKVWTTQAQASRWCLLFCRTENERTGNSDVSCLIVDMALTGITVRPVAMAVGREDPFCEVFFDDVRVAASCVLGAPHEGWAIARSSLEAERDMIWTMNWSDLYRIMGRVAERCRQKPQDPIPLDLYGRCLAELEGIARVGMSASNQRLDGRPSADTYIMKLLASEALQHVVALEANIVSPKEICAEELQDDLYESLAATIYGGTSEIQRNIIGERVLGLPRPTLD